MRELKFDVRVRKKIEGGLIVNTLSSVVSIITVDEQVNDLEKIIIYYWFFMSFRSRAMLTYHSHQIHMLLFEPDQHDYDADL